MDKGIDKGVRVYPSQRSENRKVCTIYGSEYPSAISFEDNAETPSICKEDW